MPGTVAVLTDPGLSGLCMQVGLGLETPTPEDFGVFAVQWRSPEGLIDLVENSVYRVRGTLTTDQAAVDAIPLWSMSYERGLAASVALVAF